MTCLEVLNDLSIYYLFVRVFPHQEEDKQEVIQMSARSTQCIRYDAHSLVERQFLFR